MSTQAAPAPAAAPAESVRLCRDFAGRSPHPTVAVGGPGHVVAYVNPAFARLVGRTADELIGQPFADVVPGGAGAERAALLDRVLRTGASETLAEQAAGHAPAAFWSYSAWAVPGRDGRPAGVVVQVTDATDAVTFRVRAAAVNEALLVSAARQHELIETVERGERERRALEAKMLQARKLESLGILAGGVAHDLNNMLTPVLGYADLAREELPPDSPAGPMLDEIASSARRATDLVQRVLAYAGRGQFCAQTVDPSALVRETAGLLGAVVPAGVVLRYELAPGLPAVETDVAQFRQVALNLVTNAAEATGPGGVITVGTAVAHVGRGEVWSAHLKSHLPAGLYVSLEVEDTGCGMTPAVMERVFDPFFTTKFTGRGLGLAAAQGIAHGHQGVLLVESTPGRGSAFRFLLPCRAGVPVGDGVATPALVGDRLYASGREGGDEVVRAPDAGTGEGGDRAGVRVRRPPGVPGGRGREGRHPRRQRHPVVPQRSRPVQGGRHRDLRVPGPGREARVREGQNVGHALDGRVTGRGPGLGLSGRACILAPSLAPSHPTMIVPSLVACHIAAVALAAAGGPGYVFIPDISRRVGIDREGLLLIGVLDDTGEFEQLTRLESDGLAIIYRGPPYQPILSPSAKPIPLYEFRSGTLIPGVVGAKGHFVPTIGEKLIAFADYKYRPGARRIWNLPGRFELDAPARPRK